MTKYKFCDMTANGFIMNDIEYMKKFIELLLTINDNQLKILSELQYENKTLKEKLSNTNLQFKTDYTSLLHGKFDL